MSEGRSVHDCEVRARLHVLCVPFLDSLPRIPLASYLRGTTNPYCKKSGCILKTCQPRCTAGRTMQPNPFPRGLKYATRGRTKKESGYTPRKTKNPVARAGASPGSDLLYVSCPFSETDYVSRYKRNTCLSVWAGWCFDGDGRKITAKKNCYKEERTRQTSPQARVRRRAPIYNCTTSGCDRYLLGA